MRSDIETFSCLLLAHQFFALPLEPIDPIDYKYTREDVISNQNSTPCVCKQEWMNWLATSCKKKRIDLMTSCNKKCGDYVQEQTWAG